MTTQELLDERYGRTRGARSGRFWAVFASIGIAAAVTVAGWYAFSASSASVDAVTTGYQLVDEHTTSVSFQVTVPPNTAVACVLEAQDEEHGVVGWRVVEYPPSPEHTRAFVEQIPITAEATTGLVNGCWVP